ncbi:MAG: RodZ domain-containing protein [Burkholderiaceae bacterium]|jgi:cytoskeleton protein RodZ
MNEREPGESAPGEITDATKACARFDGSEGSPAKPLGTRLRETRESLGLSAEEVASQLKIGVRKIEAIEEGRWEELPQAPYSRGFLRNYAKILHVDDARLIEELDALLGKSSEPSDLSFQPSLKTPFPQRTRGNHDSGGARLMRLGTLGFALAAGLIAWSGTESFHHSEAVAAAWIAGHTGSEYGTPVPSGPAAAMTATAVQPEAEKAPSAVAANRATPDPRTLAPPVAQAPLTLASISSSPTANDATPAQASAAPAALNGDLVMRFNDESWVEVRQADGKILMAQLNHAGAGKALDGDPPLELVIGNAPGVALQYRGSVVDLVPYTRDRVAHITLK